MEHVIAGYIRQVWEDRDWLYEGQHGVVSQLMTYTLQQKSLSVLRSVRNTTQSEHHVEIFMVKPGGT